MLDAWLVRSDLVAGQTELAALRHPALHSRLDVTRQAIAAARHLQRADRRARGSPWLGAMEWVPLGSRQLEATRDLTRAAAEVGATARGAAVALDAAAGSQVRTSADRLRLLSDMAATLGRADAHLTTVRLRRVQGPLLPPLSGARTRLVARLTAGDAALRRARSTVESFRTLFSGPRTYLVLAANNAEMRGAGGMALQAGEITFAQGTIHPAAFRPTSELLLPTSVPVPAQMQSLYGWLDPGREWRNTGSSANFTAVAPVYAAMAKAAGMGDVDGVLQVDVASLAAVLRVVGPVEAEGIRYDSADVERLVLHDLYVRYPTGSDARHDVLGKLALATMAAVEQRPWSAADMAAALGRAASGRHLLLWSKDPAEQLAWQRLGVDGSLRKDGLLLAVQNQSGNKLDWFMRSSATMLVTRHDASSRITLKLRLRNGAPPGEPAYVAGNTQPGLAFASYRTLTTVYLPADAFDVRARGGSVVVVGEDGPMRVIGIRLDVPRADSREVEIQFSLPAGRRHIQLVPAGRVEPTLVQLGRTKVSDAQMRTLRW